MKDKALRKYIYVLVLILAAFVVYEMTKKQPVSWVPTFINSDKNPYGTYIVYDLLDNVFDKKNIKESRRPIPNELGYISDSEGEGNQVNTQQRTSYLFISETFGKISLSNINKLSAEIKINETDVNSLFKFVESGNNVFIAAEGISELLLDSLNIEQKVDRKSVDSICVLANFKGQEYPFSNIGNSIVYFKTDSCSFPLKVLGYTKNEKKATFIRISFGKGYFYLHAVPVAFSNLELLNLDKYKFAFHCLSYLPKNNNVIWDEYLKQGRIGERSSFRVIWNHPALLYSYYILLLAAILFMIFRAKRMQRIIPVIDPPRNSSLDFLDTLSNLYYKKDAYESIIDKRHSYFLDIVRSRYNLSTEDISEDFKTNLSLKSGVDKQVIDDLFAIHSKILSTYDIGNKTFLSYSEKLEEFYRKMK